MKTRNIFSVLIAFLMLSSVVSTASAYEVRGTVSDGTLKTWNPQNFAGFYYDINNNLGAETLTITDANIADRVIAENGITYTTGLVPVTFEYSKDKNLPVYDAVSTYQVVGWQAEKWVALNGKGNKLVKLVTEYKSDQKSTLTGGSTLNLGNGYTMKVNQVDARAAPRQAWITVYKDGKNIDDGILQQNGMYTLRKTVGGEENVLVLSAYVSSIFSGTEADMIQLQYIWLIDENSYTEIASGDQFGVFEVTNTNPITLQNKNTVSLSQDTDVTLMGNMKIKVADSTALRFYPYVDITEDGVKTVTATPVPTVVTTSVANVTPIVTSAPCVPEVKTVTVTVMVTPEPTAVPAPVAPVVTKSAAGFEGIFAIAGLFVVAFLVLRQKQNK
jgi:S-layer protein (TIGR01567 family)